LYPVSARRNSSDLFVFDQIFVERQYQCLDNLEPKLIVDCGANVGYSSAYFLSRFRQSYLLAVEPDPANFALLQKNLAPYRGRFDAIQAAVWPRQEGLRFNSAFAGSGQEWARAVEPTRDGDINTIDIPSLIKRSPYDRISLLKIDIEEAERELFSSTDQWLDFVDNIVIELHDRQCEDVFFKAIGRTGFTAREAGNSRSV